MDYYDKELFFECSEFDDKINELKESLRNSIKSEFFDELNLLKEENKKLQKIKEDWNNLENSLKQKEHEVDEIKKSALTEAKKMTISSLIGEYQVILYRAIINYLKRPKCSNCDNDRHLHFISPSGRDISADCDCNCSDVVYKSEPFIVYEFLINEFDHKLKLWYKNVKTNDNEKDVFNLIDNAQSPKHLFDKSMNYNDINYYDVYFKTNDECQRFCNWKNSNLK
jgi:uncharacterized protein YdcH (DUF465 family)